MWQNGLWVLGFMMVLWWNFMMVLWWNFMMVLWWFLWWFNMLYCNSQKIIKKSSTFQAITTRCQVVMATTKPESRSAFPMGYSLWLWLYNSSPWYRWPMKIDGLPMKNAWWIFPWRTVNVITRDYNNGLTKLGLNLDLRSDRWIFVESPRKWSV